MSDTGDNERHPNPAVVLGALLTAPITVIASTGMIEPALAAGSEEPQQSAALPDLSTSVQPLLVNAAVQQSVHTVLPGENATDIAAKHGLTIRELLKINSLSENAILFPGQVLRLVSDAVEPSVVAKMVGPTQHIVAAGETLHSIALEYDIRLSSLLAINQLQAGSLLYPGQKLNLREVTPQTTKTKLSKVGEHEVVAGETLTSIAKSNNVSLSALLKANQLSRTSLIFVGQILEIPDSTTSSQSTTPAYGNVIGKPTNVCLFHGFHKIKSGENISKLSAKFGVSQQMLLSANRLTWNSTIYVGQKLIIPGVHGALDCPNLTVLTEEMQQNAQTIIQVGRDLGVPDYGIVIALATAMQESSLRNIAFGDRDSVGLFQQRPSAHWGSKAQIMNPEYSIRAFFGGSSSPAKGVARGLLDIAHWQRLPLTEAAQAVQVSQHPTAYAKWEPSAWKWLIQLDQLEDS